MSAFNLNIVVIFLVIGCVFGMRTLSQFSSVINQGAGAFNVSVIQPFEVGFTDEEGNQTFFASPDLAFGEAFLITGVTTQANDSFNQVTAGRQQVDVGTGQFNTSGASTGRAGGEAVLEDADSIANITQFTRQDTIAEVNTTDGYSTTRGQLASFGILRDGSSLSTTQESISGVQFTFQTGGRFVTAADTQGTAEIDATDGVTYSIGNTGATVNPGLLASECQGQTNTQAVNGDASIRSKCVLSSALYI